MANPNVDGNDRWQANCSTINDSISHFLLNEDGADIWFVPLLNAADPPKKFPAHKLILKGRSSVFNAQFRFDQMTVSKENEKKSAPSRRKKAKKVLPSNEIKEIELPDVEPEAFEHFLRFCYTDKVEITGENVASILYIANRYDVKPLMAQAMRFICENTKVENACEMLQFATEFDYDGFKEVEKRALEIIRTKTEEVVKTDAFLEINQRTLELVVSQDQLSIDQVTLFNEIIRWAKKRQTSTEENKGKSLRELLGPALFHIQFGQMDFEEFGRFIGSFFIVPKKVLTKDEVLYVYNKLSSDDFDSFYADPECPFPRFGIHQNIRILTLDIPNVNKFADETNPIWGGTVSINGLSFRLKAEKKLAESNAYLAFFVCCEGDGTENWSCHVNAELTLVNKTPEFSPNLTQKYSKQFRPVDESSWGYPDFVSFQKLFDPKYGWIDEDGTATLKARIEVISEKGIN